MAEVEKRYESPVPLTSEGTTDGLSQSSRGTRTAKEAVDAVNNLLVHAMVGAGYYNRGLYTGLLWGYAMAAQLAADLARVQPHAPELAAQLAPADEAAFQNALRPLRRGGVQAVRLVAANVAALYSRYLKRACAALGLPYQRRLDREVNAYLFREGVFAHDATVANPAP